LSEKEQDEKAQIEKLKQIALKPAKAFTAEHSICEGAVDALAAYGEIAVPALIQIADKADEYIRPQALDRIEKIKKEAKEKAENKSKFGR
jgi:altronate dehydratase